MKEVVAFTSKRFREQQEDAADGSAHIGRGTRKLCSPFTDGRKHVERGGVVEGACVG